MMNWPKSCALIFIFLMMPIFADTPQLESFQTYQGKFAQQTLNKKNGHVLFKTSGKIWLAPSSFFRWQVGNPIQRIILQIHHNNFWVIEPPLDQAIQYEAAQHIAAQLPALLLSGQMKSLQSYFQFKRLASSGHVERYQLLPKKSLEILRYAIIYIQDQHLIQLDLHDQFDHLIRIKFTHPIFNHQIDPKVFALNIPTHYDKISIKSRS
jgi:outer membrane lipoprotein-sorting protein